MVNAVEHGNLGVTYREKSLLKWEGDWEGKSVADSNCRSSRGGWRRFAPGYRRRPLSSPSPIRGRASTGEKFMQFDPERAFDPNGRGIAMAKAMSFSSLCYQGKGNVVVASVAVV